MNRLKVKQIELSFADTCRNNIGGQYKVRVLFLIITEFEGNTDIYLQNNLEYYE